MTNKFYILSNEFDVAHVRAVLIMLCRSGRLYVIPVMEYLRCGDYSGPHDTGTAAAALSP